MAAKRAREEARRQAEQARARERAEREARERARQEESERQRQEQERRSRRRTDREERERRIELQRVEQERERLRRFREFQERQRAQRNTFLGTALAGMIQPGLRDYAMRRQPEFLNVRGAHLVTRQAERAAAAVEAGLDRFSFWVNQGASVVASALGIAGEMSTVAMARRTLRPVVRGRVPSPGTRARVESAAAERVGEPRPPGPTAIRNLSYQQDLTEVGNEFHLLVDIPERTGKGGLGVLEFPAEFQRLADQLGKPVRAGFAANVTNPQMGQLITRMGFTTREFLTVGTDRGLSSSAAYTKMFYPRGR